MFPPADGNYLIIIALLLPMAMDTVLPIQLRNLLFRSLIMGTPILGYYIDVKTELVVVKELTGRENST